MASKIQRWNGTAWVPILDGSTYASVGFSQVTAGSTTLTAATSTDTLILAAGTGIGITGVSKTATFVNSGVISVAGTTNQILVNGASAASSGTLTLSLPNSVTITGQLNSGNHNITGGTSPVMLLGSTWPSGNTYAAITVTGMGGTGYGMLMSTTDTFISSGSGGTYLRGPSNSATQQIVISSTGIAFTGSLTGGLTIATGGLTVTAGGLTVTAGGLFFSTRRGYVLTAVGKVVGSSNPGSTTTSYVTTNANTSFPTVVGDIIEVNATFDANLVANNSIFEGTLFVNGTALDQHAIFGGALGSTRAAISQNYVYTATTTSTTLDLKFQALSNNGGLTFSVQALSPHTGFTYKVFSKE